VGRASGTPTLQDEAELSPQLMTDARMKDVHLALALTLALALALTLALTLTLTLTLTP